MTNAWTDPVTLVGRLLTLSPLSVADAADYLQALGADEIADQITAHLSFSPPRTLEEAQDHLQSATTSADRLPYAQRLSATGEFVGTTSFYEIRPAVCALAVGYTWIASKFWRTGVNTDSKLIMLTRAFEGLGAERVVWHTDIFNTRSQTAIQRLGATREGVLRHHKIRRDESWRDTVQYSMLADEWPAAKSTLVSRRPCRPRQWSG